MTDNQVLKRLEFPAYCVRVLDNGLIAVAGGGGTAKTGVGNCIELGIIDYSSSMNENTNTTNSLVYNFNHAQFQSIHKFEPNDAIMKFISFTYDRSYNLMKKQQQAKLKTKKTATPIDLVGICPPHRHHHYPRQILQINPSTTQAETICFWQQL